MLVAAASIAGAMGWLRYQDSLVSRRPPEVTYAADGSEIAPLTDLAPGATTDVQTMANRLEEENRKLRTENQDLRNRLAKAMEANTPPPTPETLVRRFEEMRGAKFDKVPEFVALPYEELQILAKNAASAQITQEASGARNRAYLALGLVSTGFDFRAEQMEIFASQVSGIHDLATNRLSHQDDLDLRRFDARERFMTALHQAFLAQKFPAGAIQPVGTANDDAARALRALALGETALFRVLWSTTDDYPRNLDVGVPPQQPMPPQAQRHFSEEYKFLTVSGHEFVTTLMQENGNPALDAAYKRPPRSTAEIMHPALYLADPPFVPRDFTFTENDVQGARPYFSNVVGEWGIYDFLQQTTSIDLVIPIAEGWMGDRYWIYQSESGRGDHVLWKSAWRSLADANDFYQALRKNLMGRHSIPWQKEYDVPGGFVVNDPNRCIRLRLNEADFTVTLIDATNQAFANALEAQAAAHVK